MSTPTRQMVHTNRPLTNISIAYMQNHANFVADSVFPVVPVDKQGNLYYRYNRGDFNRDEMRERAPGTESAGGGWTLDTDSYFAKVWAFHKDINNQDRANADEQINLDRDATEYVTMKALLKKEKIFVTKAFSASIWASEKIGHASVANSTQVIHWSDQTSGTPIEDVQAAKTAVQLKTGFEPNVLTLGKQVWDALVNHPDILDRIKYSSNNSTPAIVSRQAMAALFEVEEIKVMKAIENTAAEPTAYGSDTNAFIGGKHALLSYRPSRAGLLTPSAGYTFAWTGLMGGAFGSQISSFPMVNLKSERIEIEMAFDMKMTGTDLGYFFNLVVA